MDIKVMSHLNTIKDLKYLLFKLMSPNILMCVEGAMGV